MSTAISEVLRQFSITGSGDFSALSRACAWSVPDQDDIRLAIARGGVRGVDLLLNHSRLPAISRAALATNALVHLCEDPLACHQPADVARCLLSAGATLDPALPSRPSPLDLVQARLARIEQEEASNSRLPSTSAGDALRSLHSALANAAGLPERVARQRLAQKKAGAPSRPSP